MADFVIKPTTGNLKIQDDQDVDRIVIAPTTGVTTLSNPSITLGSDATGDVYYRAAGGALTRLATGADGTVLTSTGAGAVPAFEATPVIDCDADSWLYSRYSVVLYSSNSVFDFDTVIKTGSNISESAGSVTVGTAGWYYIFWKITDHNNTQTVNCKLRKNDTGILGTMMYAPAAADNILEGGFYSESFSTIIEASANDVFHIYGTARLYGEDGLNSLSWFGGVRLGA